MSRSVLIAATTCALILAWPAAAPAQLVMVDEGFEGYTAGTYPGSPWANLFDGESGLVSTDQAVNGTQSFRSESQPSWARWDYTALPYIPLQITYRASVYVVTAGRGGAVGFGFEQPGVSGTGWWANAVHFAGDGNVYFSTRTAGATAVGTWTPGTWHRVEVSIDYVGLLADVTLDDVVVATDLATDEPVLPATVYGTPVPLDQFGMFGDNFPGPGNGVIYYDDLFLSDDQPLPVHPSSWGRIKALYATD